MHRRRPRHHRLGGVARGTTRRCQRDPLWAVVYATEVLGVLTGVVVAVVIARHPRCAASTPHTSTPATLAPSSSNPDVSRSRRHGRDPDGYPAAIGDLLRIAPEPELRASVRNVWRTAFAAHVPIADRALALVRFEGMRRLVLIVGLVLSLLLGVAPLERPAPWMLGVAAAGLVLTSVGSTLLAGGRIRPGDRLRWSFASIGLTVGPSERSDSMPVRWAAVMGSIVVLNLAVALRGLSDRWTHGLPPMADADRVVAMVRRPALVVGCLHAAAPPAATRTRAFPHVSTAGGTHQPVSPRSAATAIAGIVGLLAGILPGVVDAADRARRPDREQYRPQVNWSSTRWTQTPPRLGIGLVDGPEMPDAATE